MDIVIVGHVDHGKSTLVGRLLADTKSLPEGRLEKVKAECARNSKPFEYAFLLDALKDEQSQGITIDAARVFFRTPKRPYTIIDAPGHIEFLRNMVTGAARAEAALLVIDAKEGVKENSRRHGYLLSMLGVRQIAVIANKMDLIGYSQEKFNKLRDEYIEFLSKLDIKPAAFIPAATLEGENVVERSKSMPWYKGGTVVETLDAFHSEEISPARAFRMPVQDVYKFTKGGDDRRIVAGNIDSGTVRIGDQVVFFPSGKKSTVKSIEAFNRPTQFEAQAGMQTGFTLTEQIFVARGEVACLASDPNPFVTTRVRVSVFWLGRTPLQKKRDYILKIGTAKVSAKVSEILRVLDTSSLDAIEGGDQVPTNSVAECVLRLDKPIAADLASSFPGTGRFVLVDGFDISGGGLIRESIPDEHTWIREKVLLRNHKWESGIIPAESRAEKYNQKATLILITSAKSVERKSIAKALEAELFEAGRIVYFLGMGNAMYGIGADIHGKPGTQQESLRRFGELSNVFLDAGMLLIATAAELTQDQLEIVKTVVRPERIETIWVGDEMTTDLVADAKVRGEEKDCVSQIHALLQEKGIIFKPW